MERPALMSRRGAIARLTAGAALADATDHEKSLWLEWIVIIEIVMGLGKSSDSDA